VVSDLFDDYVLKIIFRSFLLLDINLTSKVVMLLVIHRLILQGLAVEIDLIRTLVTHFNQL